MYQSHIGTHVILSCLFLWGPAKISTQSWYLCLSELIYDLSRTKFSTRGCWTWAQLKAHNSCNVHSKWSQLCPTGKGRCLLDVGSPVPYLFHPLLPEWIFWCDLKSSKGTQPALTLKVILKSGRKTSSMGLRELVQIYR